MTTTLEELEIEAREGREDGDKGSEGEDNGEPKKKGKKKVGGQTAVVYTLCRVTIKGTAAMYQDHMTDEQIENQLIRRQREQAKTDLSLRDMAERKLYRGPKDEYGVPADCLWSCLVGAGSYIKYDARKSISTGDSTRLAEIIDLKGQFIPFDDQEHAAKWRVSVIKGNMKSGTSKVACGVVRPAFNTPWRLTFYIVHNSDNPVGLDKVQLLIRKAGKLQGLGSWRPSCRGRKGMFRLESFQTVRSDEEGNPSLPDGTKVMLLDEEGNINVTGLGQVQFEEQAPQQEAPPPSA